MRSKAQHPSPLLTIWTASKLNLNVAYRRQQRREGWDKLCKVTPAGRVVLVVGKNSSGISSTILGRAPEKQTGWDTFLTSRQRMKSTWRGSMCQQVIHITAATSGSAQKKNMRFFLRLTQRYTFRVINGRSRNSPQWTMQLLQSSFSGVINQSSWDT